MKKSLFRFTSYTIIVYLTCLNLAVAAPQPSGENDEHFCGFDAWQRDNRRYARSFAANLNVGEPRTVRMIYFLPNDRPYRAEVVQQMKNDIREIQAFYAEQMKAHGYGFSTFRVETDAQGEPMIHRVDGQHSESHYLDDASSTVPEETGQTFDLNANVYLIVFDNSSGVVGQRGGRFGGLGERTGKNSGFALVPEPTDVGLLRVHVAAHELGHAFGLNHDFNNLAYLMSYGSLPQSRLSACHAEFLAVHPYFNPDVEAQAAPPPTIELISPLTYPAGSESVSVQLKLSDSDGLHQVLLVNGRPEVWGCRGLAGKKDALVEFDFDGYSGFQALFWNNPVGLSDFDSHRIIVRTVDTDGNESSEHFTLSETAMHSRPESLVKVSGDNQQGPTGAQLAQSFVVEVRDQDDKPLPSAKVMFTVIAGEGKLSGRFTVENAMTDANGRAEKTLTPGYGTNIVEVTIQVIGLNPPSVTFSGIGIGVPTVPTMDGDYRTWHLPDGATIRLGKGRIGESDRAVAFSPDGQLLAVASSIGVWLYDAATSRELTLLPSTSDEVHSVAFSRDGKRLAWGSGIGLDAVVVWDVVTQTQIATAPNGSITSLSFSPDGRTLAFGAESELHKFERVKLLDIASGNVAILEDKLGARLGFDYIVPLSVSFSPDGTTLAFGSERDGTVKLWDVATQTLITSLSGHKLSVTSVSFSPDGRLLASGSIDETVKLWDVSARENIATLKGHTHTINSVSFSPDGTTLASCSHGGASGGTIKLWDVATGRNISTIGPLRWGVLAVSFSPDGTTLASGSYDGTVKLYDVKSGNVEFAISGHGAEGKSVSISRDGTLLASGGQDGTIKLWDVSTGRNVETFGVHDLSVNAVSYSPDGRLLASGSRDGTVKLWDVSTGKNVASRFTYRCSGAVNSVSFSIDGVTLASGDAWGVLLWNSATGAQISTPAGYASWVRSVSFSPDGTILAFGADFGAKLWDVATHTPIATLGHASQVGSVSFSPDGTILAFAGGYGEPITLWDVLTRENIGTLDLPAFAKAVPLSFSSDGTTLAAGAGRKVILWDVSASVPLAILEGHTGRNTVGVTSVSFSPDATILASGSDDDGTILLWDMSGWRQTRLEALAEINIPDPNLRAAIAEAIGLPPSTPIFRGHLGNLTLLDASNANISNLTGLEGATNLRTLDLGAEYVEAENRSINSNSISDFSPLTGLTKLRTLNLGDNKISDISAVAGLTNLTTLELGSNDISDISAISGLTNLRTLYLWNNNISDISALSGLTQLTALNLSNNNISDVSHLVTLKNLTGTSWDSTGLYLYGNPLSYTSINTHIPAMQANGVEVKFDNRTPTTLLNISGAITASSNTLTVEVRDSNGRTFEGVPVTFTVTSGGGTLSVTNITTDEKGRAQSILTLGPNLGRHTVLVSAAGIEVPATFNAEGSRIPKTLEIISGADQEGLPGDALEKPFVVEVRDEFDKPLPGAQVTFTVTSGDGTLSEISVTTDSNGRAESTLTLGSTPGANTVRVSVEGNTQAVAFLTIESARTPMFTLAIPAGTHAIHIPLAVKQINGEDAVLETVGDLYNALGDAVSYIITVGDDGGWKTYLGSLSAGTAADAAIGDDTGLIVVMSDAKTLELAGDMLGTAGASMINIDVGNNLVGLPLKPAAGLSMISDLLVDGVGAIAVSKADGLGFHTIREPGQDGDGPIVGGVGYLVVYIGTEATSIPIVGSAWENSGAVSAAPAVAFNGTQTPVLYVEGGVMDEFNMLSRIPELRVTVKNLSTGASLDTVLGTELSTTAYSATFVELSRHAAKVGEVLEIVAHSPNPFVGVRPVPQIVVSAEEVLTSRISLPDMELYEIPSESELLANYPNPFNPETWIPYRLAKAAEVTLDIYDTNGSLVRTIDVGFKPAAVYESRASAIYWDGRNNYGERVASGVYFYHLSVGAYSATRKMLIMK